MSGPDAEQLLAEYDRQTRLYLPEVPPTGYTFERVGPLLRWTGGFRGFVGSGPDVGVAGADLDALVAEQVQFFAGRGESFEWKTRSHDRPADLPDRLLAAGFVPEDTETVLIGDAEAMAQMATSVVGLTIRQVTDRVDLDRIAAMQCAVWGDDFAWLADDLAARVEGHPDQISVYVAEADGEVVSSAWLVRRPGTDFAGLWGGSTLPQWRRRGVYRALIAVRAQRAVEQGARWLQVDASPDSRPILERLGFVTITTTTPYVWSAQTEV